ncbi:D-alanyl-D-alanine carboxypeptidase family protein [Gehongia tenuis]|uniref:D-alanyl-D-alanine carboxypeptidase family protein n=1 Tax=Gehongia tenuis TaxID=2763655 RepID=A0A926HP59_9FIRM|nr:D-alanyl-D-alanine carboxypeptidase family protein [Gehongia tenuis]MBC8530345.1 D-alanyl-D-alanine carboxypeptidase family protein [Gehongia tenuis]
MRVRLTAEMTHQGTLILVNRDHPLPEAYVDLVPALPRTRVFLERRAAAAFRRLLAAAAGKGEIVPVSGYRSQKEQDKIYRDSLLTNGPGFTAQFVARPGESEHASGLALDVGQNLPVIDPLCPHFPGEGPCLRFSELAPRYGFTLRYPAGKEPITAIAHEPWHFRYVGRPHAAILAEYGWTLEEYVEHLSHAGGLVHRQDGRVYEITRLAPGVYDLPAKTALSGDNAGGFILTRAL